MKKGDQRKTGIEKEKNNILFYFRKLNYKRSELETQSRKTVYKINIPFLFCFLCI